MFFVIAHNGILLRIIRNHVGSVWSWAKAAEETKPYPSSSEEIGRPFLCSRRDGCFYLLSTLVSFTDV